MPCRPGLLFYIPYTFIFSFVSPPNPPFPSSHQNASHHIITLYTTSTKCIYYPGIVLTIERIHMYITTTHGSPAIVSLHTLYSRRIVRICNYPTSCMYLTAAQI